MTSQSRKLSHFFRLSVVLLGVTQLSATQWLEPRAWEYRAASGRFSFKVTPHDDWEKRPGHCLGQLLKVDGGSKTVVWEWHLVNNTAPTDVIVTDSGEYAITLGEWFKGSSAFTVVIYGKRGEVVRIHDLDTLRLTAEGFTVAGNDVLWLKDSIRFFGPKEKTLFYRLSWGQILMLDLGTGDVMDEEWFKRHKERDYRADSWKHLRDHGVRQTASMAMAMLTSDVGADRRTAAKIVGEMQIRRAVPHLKLLLRDPATSLTSRDGGKTYSKIFFVRAEARRALIAMGFNPGEVTVEQPEK